uniref:DNA-(apurinic or apyrimidinic site) endonuclease n=1 Tax=Meloidogyne floridensis TaxID=298350 RepID=A0A915PCC7_9BILA
QTALAWEPVFSDRFLQNYEQWLEQEVYGHQTDWDGGVSKYSFCFYQVWKMPPKKKINSSRSIATLGVAAVASRKVKRKKKMLEKMLRMTKLMERKADKNNGKNIKNQGKNVNEQEENAKEQGTIVKDQGRSVRSTRATTRQNGQSTSNNNGNDETWEEEEKEKTPRKRKHFPLFEKTPASQKNKKFKKGQPLKIWTWNVAGLRANVKKNGHVKIKESDADIVSLQETKCPELPSEIEALDEYCFKKLAKSTKNLGHAGVAMLAKEMPINVTVGLGNKDFDEFGRYIEAEYKNFFFISVYVPNSGSGLVNLPARGRWDQMFLTRVIDLDKRKPVIIAGDMNVAHQEIDLRNPDSNRNKTAGFTDQEREAFTRLLDAGFVDVWRSRNPDVAEIYTYWSYIGTRRAKNIGWRLDYFVISERLLEKVIECEIHSDITGSAHGSDHCPLSLIIDI